MKNASDFPDLYSELFDFANAGYVMLRTDSPFQYVPMELRELGYTSPDPTKFWMKGFSDDWHVTVRGPLDPKVRQEHCRKILNTCPIPLDLELGNIEIFPSPYPEEEYVCAVVIVEDQTLFELNAQLALLPGVQTYVPYRPHLTLGYFKAGHNDLLIDKFTTAVSLYVPTIGYDYGRMPA